MRYFVIFSLTLLICGGCETLTGQQQRLQQTRLYNEVANLKIEVARLEQQLVGFGEEREALYAQLTALQQGQQESDSRHYAELRALHDQLASQTQDQERLRQELTADLSAKMAKILQAQAATAASAVRAQAGYVHVVKAGQTLSEIAREYNSTTAAIVSANDDVKNPNDIKVGQEIFIPE